MSDARLRALERAWKKSGALADEAAWLRERVRSGDDAPSRITFPGNPWPAGHRLKSLVWKGRLEETGVWFDLDLETVDYDADDPPDLPEQRLDGLRDWEARIAWNNYHACHLEANRGFLAATRRQKLDLDRLPEREWRVDPLKRGQTAESLKHDDLAFHTYLLGHDTVADHRLRFVLREDTDRWWLRWTGRVALTYAGRDAFEHAFALPFALARFEGLRVDMGLGGQAAACALLARHVVRPEGWRFERHHGTSAWFVPEGATSSRP